MCRNIKRLYNFEPPATQAEIDKASRQFVRKISGFTSPSKVNEASFEHAVNEISNTVSTLLATLETKAAPRDRDQENEKKQRKLSLRIEQASVRGQ